MEVYILQSQRVSLRLAFYSFFYIGSKFWDSITYDSFILTPLFINEIIGAFNFLKILIFIILKTFRYSFTCENVSHILKCGHFLIHDISTCSFWKKLHSFGASNSFSIFTHRPTSQATYLTILIHKAIICTFCLDSNIINPFIDIFLSRTLKLFGPKCGFLIYCFETEGYLNWTFYFFFWESLPISSYKIPNRACIFIINSDSISSGKAGLRSIFYLFYARAINGGRRVYRCSP